MQTYALCLLALVSGFDDKKAPAPAKLTITAETACGHCTFGFGDSCALCLKLDDVTPIILEGKSTEKFFESRLSGTVLIVEGTLTVNKDKRLVLKAEKARVFADKDKGKAPNKGEARIEGEVISVKGSPAIRNGNYPIALAGKHTEGKPASLTGELAIDKDGKLRLGQKKPDSDKRN